VLTDTRKYFGYDFSMPQTRNWSLAHYLPIAFLLAILASMVRAGADTTTHEALFSKINQIGTDLYEMLPSKYRQQFYGQPVALDTNVMPFVKAIEFPKSSLRLVVVSVGFLDLIHNVSHAKAIDRIEPGYFQKCIARLAQESDGMSVRALPGISNRTHWSTEVINEKESYFNQMLAGVVGIKLSHPYERYAQNTTSSMMPINQSLAVTEWEKSVSIGVQSALDCGYGIEGLQTLCDAIDLMPNRPTWATDLLPANAKISRLKSQLAKQERIFFHGK